MTEKNAKLMIEPVPCDWCSDTGVTPSGKRCPVLRARECPFPMTMSKTPVSQGLTVQHDVSHVPATDAARLRYSCVKPLVRPYNPPAVGSPSPCGGGSDAFPIHRVRAVSRSQKPRRPPPRFRPAYSSSAIRPLPSAPARTVRHWPVLGVSQLVRIQTTKGADDGALPIHDPYSGWFRIYS